MTLQTLLESAAGLYGVSASQFSPLSGGNFAHVYEFKLSGRETILRITPPDAGVDLHATRAVLHWLAFLGEQGGPVASPVCSLSGELVQPLSSGGQEYLVSAFEKAPGVLAEGISPADWSDALFQGLGRTLGACHRIAGLYSPVQDEFIRPQWDQSGNCFNPCDDLPGAEAVVLEKRDAVLAVLQSLPKDKQSYGLAHLDLHFGNFFVDAEAGRVTFFDFDDCGYGWYMMDIAMLLFDVLVVYDGLDRLRFGEHFLTNLLKGYHAHKPVSLYWIQQLPHFMKLVEIGVYLMLYRSYDPATAGEWVGKFMPSRRERIEQDVPYLELDWGAVHEQVLASS